MIEEMRQRTKTDEAWERLYARLNDEHLLLGRPAVRKGYSALRIGSAIALAAVFAGFVYLTATWWVSSDEGRNMQELVTQKNMERSTLVKTLEDGSIVYLAEKSTLKYPEHFATDKREVNLQGEAFFDVARKQRQRFTIETEKVRVEVLGTAFNVRSKDDSSFSLSVKRGKVRVSLKENGQYVDVKAGETVTLQSRRLHLSANKSNAFMRYASDIRFKDESLDHILRVINLQTSSLQLQAASAALGKRKLTIELEDYSPETAARLIGMALNLKYTRQGNQLILSE